MWIPSTALFFGYEDGDAFVPNDEAVAVRALDSSQHDGFQRLHARFLRRELVSSWMPCVLFLSALDDVLNPHSVPVPHDIDWSNTVACDYCRLVALL